MDSDEVLKPLGVFALVVVGAVLALAVVGFALGAGSPALSSDGADIDGQSPGQYQPENLQTQFAGESGQLTVDGPDGDRAVLVDTLHENRLPNQGADIVQSAMFEAGYSVDLIPGGGTAGPGTPTSLTEGNLSQYNGILVVQPEAGFSSEERDALQEYVDGGGHVVVMAEPTRSVPLRFSSVDVEFAARDLVRQFGMKVDTQTLFNLDDASNDNNYKSIYAAPVSGADSALTEGVDTVTFDIATRVGTRDNATPVFRAFPGTTTIEDRRSGEFPTVARSEGGNVVVVSDTSILERSELYDADNEVFVGNVLEFLAAGSPS